MKSYATVLFVVLLVLAASCGRGGESAKGEHAAPPERTLVGQVLLPSGVGSRGVEVLVTIMGDGSEPVVVWVLFDEPIPSPVAYDLAKEARAATDYAAVDCFPNAPTSDHSPMRCGGGWVRLPGRHHTPISSGSRTAAAISPSWATPCG